MLTLGGGGGDDGGGGASNSGGASSGGSGGSTSSTPPSPPTAPAAEVSAAVAEAASELTLILATADSLPADVAQGVTTFMSDLLEVQGATGEAPTTEASSSIQTAVFELARACLVFESLAFLW